GPVDSSLAASARAGGEPPVRDNFSYLFELRGKKEPGRGGAAYKKNRGPGRRSRQYRADTRGVERRSIGRSCQFGRGAGSATKRRRRGFAAQDRAQPRAGSA